MDRSVSSSSRRAWDIRRSVIHSPTVRPVRRPTMVVRWPGSHADRFGDLAGGKRTGAALVDDVEDLREQRLVVASRHLAVAARMLIKAHQPQPL